MQDLDSLPIENVLVSIHGHPEYGTATTNADGRFSIPVDGGGTITLVYDHEIRDLTEKLIDYQHQVHGAVISSLHVHLDKHNCLEVLVVKGKGREIKKVADKLIGTRGVKHGKLVTTTTGRGIF